MKARWNKVINPEVAKYIGYLTAALREYKSGWQYAEYTNKAKDDFQHSQGKVFRHELLYNMLKREMTKYNIPLDTIIQRVARGLNFLDNEGCNDEEESLVDNVLEVGEDESLLDPVLVAVVATGGETVLPRTEAAGKENTT